MRTSGNIYNDVNKDSCGMFIFDFVFISEKVTIKEGFGRPLGYSGVALC